MGHNDNKEKCKTMNPNDTTSHKQQLARSPFISAEKSVELCQPFDKVHPFHWMAFPTTSPFLAQSFGSKRLESPMRLEKHYEISFACFISPCCYLAEVFCRNFIICYYIPTTGKSLSMGFNQKYTVTFPTKRREKIQVVSQMVRQKSRLAAG